MNDDDEKFNESNRVELQHYMERGVKTCFTNQSCIVNGFAVNIIQVSGEVDILHMDLHTLIKISLTSLSVTGMIIKITIFKINKIFFRPVIFPRFGIHNLQSDLHVHQLCFSGEYLHLC